jgi:putative holliday junction resolvase
MRAVGIDLGSRRIGVAVSNSLGTLAVPRQVVERSGDPAVDHEAIFGVVEEVGATVVVVGLPRSLDGRLGPAARGALDEVKAMSERFGPRGVTVETIDERLTTVTAQRALAEGGHSGRARRHVIDQSAAAVLLQSWLDAHRGSPSSDGSTTSASPGGRRARG